MQLCFVVIVGMLISFRVEAQMAGKERLRGHVPPAIAKFHLRPLHDLAPTNHLRLAIGLPLRNEKALDELLGEIYNPASANYHHYLTPQEFTARFGPSQKEYNMVVAFAKANGLKVTATFPDRTLVDVSGNVAAIQKAFHVTLRVYKHPHESRDFYAPDVEPSINLDIPNLHISGLDNFAVQKPQLKIASAEPLSDNIPRSGSGPGNSYDGNDFRTAYLPGVTTNELSGAGQSIALVEFEGYYSNDIAIYESQAGLPNVSLTNVLIDGFSGNPTSVSNNAIVEVSLDIEMGIAMAPGISKIFVYEAPNGSPWADILRAIANDNFAEQISCSWGQSSPGAPDPISEGYFKQMATQGQSFFNASGDSDAFTSGIPFPSESTNITEVGGTTLSTSGPGGVWTNEAVWNRGSGIGSSGGVSSNYALPYWQQGIDMTASQGSTSQRNVPDVALTADHIYVVANNNHSYNNVGGTSCAAPLWAGYIALANQKAVAAGRPTVGFINPAIYALGRGVNYNAYFHDITNGNNFWSSSPTLYAATNGYDLCTGWGTPNGINLINALAIPDPLFVTPLTGFSTIGVTGGPFTTTSENFFLTNSGNSSLNWVAVNSDNLFDAFPASGTLPAGGTATVTVQLSSTALNLLPGIYAPSITFSNETTGIGQDRQCDLEIGQSYVQNGGFEAGSFANWTFFGTGIAGTIPYNMVVNATSINNGGDPYYATNFIHSGIYGSALGQTNGLAYLYQTIPTLPGQNYVISFWLDQVDGGNPDQFVVNWNTNWPATNTIFSISNIGPFPWTNYQFVVTATGTNTVLQFGSQNDLGYFGLDDIAVYPVPLPLFRSITVTNNVVAFTWNSFTNLAYRLQYSTDLATGNWITLGTNSTAGSLATGTNMISTDPQRFYRIQLLP